MSSPRDPYKVLGVAKGASADEIKKAYRKLARELHPDVNPGDAAAEERFKRVSEAYAVLSDPKKKNLFDRYGAEGLREGFDARAYERMRSASGHFDPSSFTGFEGGFGVDLGDLFGHFDGFSAFGGAPPRGRDLDMTLRLSFEDAVEAYREIDEHPERCIKLGVEFRR